MCGIAGIIRTDGSQPQQSLIRAMTNSLRHRGPDGEGVFLRDNIALGHRRLSIIDLAGGKQPMCNEDGSVWVTFNGEIYNYRELREDLEGRGHVFKTKSDTEVIVHAYEQWGADCVRQFRGMFGFGLADLRRRKIVVARDHFGIKPIFIRFGKDYVAFASEMQALLLTEETRPRIVPQAIDYFLRYRYIPHPDTVYENIVKLPPASHQTFDFDGNSSGPQRYWRLEFKPNPKPAEPEWRQQFDEIFRDSIRTHLVADVPFGAFLSGGVDSSLVAMQMSEILEHPVRAFTIGFHEESYSEIKHARRVAKKLGVDLHAEIVKPDVVAILGELSAHYGEPYGDTSALPTWCVSKMARDHVPMVLSGDGADEAFAGYARYDHWMQAGSRPKMAKYLTHTRQSLRQLFASIAPSSASGRDQWERLVGHSTANQRRALWRKEFQQVVDGECSTFVNAHRLASAYDRVANVQSVDIETYLPGDILTKVDIASMCHGLEVRTPLTDLRVIEFAATLPLHQRHAVDSTGKGTMKPLLKQKLARRFPRDFVTRTKQGFGIPELEWLKHGSPVRTLLDDTIHSSNALVFDYLNPAAARELTRQFDRSGSVAALLWQVLILSIWLEMQNGVRSLERAA